MGTYKLPLGGDPDSKLMQLKKAARERGIDFRGTVDEGDFSGRGLKGYYRRESGDIIVTIIKTPFFISESAIVSQLKDFLSG